MSSAELFQRKLANQKLSLQEYSESKTILRSRPSKLIVELTQNCNFKCTMCEQSHTAKFPQYARYNPSLNMDLGLFDRVASELFENAYLVDLRGFGESVIHPQWAEIVDRVESYPLVDWHLVTNLSLPRDAIWEKLIERRFILGISFDGATAATFEKIRVRSHFNTILHNLKVVSDATQRLGQGHLYFIVTVQKENVEELPAIVEIARDHGVRDVQFKMVYTGPYNKHLAELPKGTRASVSRALDVAIESETRLSVNDQALIRGLDAKKVEKASKIPYPSPILNFSPPKGADSSGLTATMEQVRDHSRVAIHKSCFKAYHYTYIASDGRVGTCNHMMNPTPEFMGDLKTSSFEDIWNGERYQFFRAWLRRGQPFCGRCQWCFQHRLED